MSTLCRRRKGEVSCLTIRLTGASDASYHKVKWNPSYLLLAAAVAATALRRQLPTHKSCSPLHHLGIAPVNLTRVVFPVPQVREFSGPSGRLLRGPPIWEASLFGPSALVLKTVREDEDYFCAFGQLFSLWPYLGFYIKCGLGLN